MSGFVTLYPHFGKIYSIIGLFLVPFHTSIRRNYSSVLDMVQLSYIFSLVFAPQHPMFANHLDYSWLTFMPTFIHFCQADDFICIYGNLISPMFVWTILAVLVFIVVLLIRIKRRGVHYQPFYNFYKGFFRWFFGPLMYFATQEFILAFLVNLDASTFYPSIGVYIYGIVIVLLEMVGYACAQTPKENTVKKWVQFSSHARMAFTMIILNVVGKNHPDVKYAIIGSFIFYDYVHLAKYLFGYKPIEIILFIVQEICLYMVMLLFIYWPNRVAVYHFDFILVSITIIIEVFLIIIRIYYRCTLGSTDVGLQDDRDKMKKKMIQNLRQKKNKAEHQARSQKKNQRSQRSNSSAKGGNKKLKNKVRKASTSVDNLSVSTGNGLMEGQRITKIKRIF